MRPFVRRRGGGFAVLRTVRGSHLLHKRPRCRPYRRLVVAALRVEAGGSFRRKVRGVSGVFLPAQNIGQAHKQGVYVALYLSFLRILLRLRHGRLFRAVRQAVVQLLRHCLFLRQPVSVPRAVLTGDTVPSRLRRGDMHSYFRRGDILCRVLPYAVGI